MATKRAHNTEVAEAIESVYASATQITEDERTYLQHVIKMLQEAEKSLMAARGALSGYSQFLSDRYSLTPQDQINPEVGTIIRSTTVAE